VIAFLAAPKTTTTFIVFSVAIGFTYLATVPPTVGLVVKLHGMRFLATLFGIVMLSHQIGGFLGAWLGGKMFEATGGYEWMWYADVMLAFAAALIHLPISEAPRFRSAAAAA
jgi:predicted MFS family arabinose efflux permease